MPWHYADAAGGNHMQEVEFALLPKQVFRNNLPLRLSETTGSNRVVAFVAFPRAPIRSGGTIHRTPSW